MKKITLLFLFISTSLLAQDYFPKNDGVKSQNNNYTAFENAKIFISPTKTIENGTLLIKNDKIIAVGKSVKLPKNTVRVNLDGKSIYPSFIDVFSNFGMAKIEAKSRTRSPQYDSKRTGYYWNEHIIPEQQAVSTFKYNKKDAKALRELGFGVVNTHVQDGIIRGTGALVTLNDHANNNVRILDNQSAQYFSFKRSKKSRQTYPNSLMGSMALIKQVFLDNSWYLTGNSNTTDLSLEAFNRNKKLVQIFDASSKTNVLRANKIGTEFNTPFVVLGGGDEYELIDEIKATNTKYILPLNFPKAYDVGSAISSDYIQLSDMRDWNQAPTNPAAFQKKDIPFALTTHGLEKLTSFRKNLTKATDYGLSDQWALKALTTIPAQILNQSDVVGTLEAKKLANFIITSGNVFDKETIIYQNWVQGKPHIIKNFNSKNIVGPYQLTVGKNAYDATISGNQGKYKISIKKDSTKLSGKVQYSNNWVHIQFKNNKKEFIRLSGQFTGKSTIKGVSQNSLGQESSFTMRKTDKEKTDKASSPKTREIVPLTFPNIAYGFDKKPEQQTILIKNATVWTNEADGKLEQTDVLIKNGKIEKIGKNLKSGRALVIDGTDKHLTAGIIDEHAHIATLSTNESGQNSTAEVRMKEALNYEDINIYRALAGGVTQAQILHGSANPIGGRSAIIKMKWGETSEGLIDHKAPKFIKFALGENVKQSNWSSFSRFPQTRMGVEQVYVDYFQRAKDYDQLKKSGKPYRKDLELETLAEIINKERFISCHSYVQSEINMLMKVAEQFNFNINTFTHILEGYKVADKMKEHGVGGSTFSDWWAYKYEVNDAIPYNAAIMHKAGVVTAINSDDAEMMRRLNQEAAKTVKYGGLTEEEALKLITLNPAKLLHIDNRVGSIKIGKEADVVLWSAHPLSVSAKAEKTIIEGIVYFDIERDAAMRKDIQKERAILIDQMLQEKIKGKPVQEVKKKKNLTNHCDTVNHI